MKKVIWMLLWFITIESSGWAKDSTVWHSGELTLLNGTELTGDLSFSWIAQVVQYRQGAVIKAYSVNQVRTFTYFDNNLNNIRKFVAVNHSEKPGRQRLRILEEVISGYVVVYRELRMGHELIKAATVSDFGSDEELTRNIDNYTYFVFSGDELIGLRRFYNQIWPRMKNAFHNELKQYANLIRADVTGTLGQLRLINMYNCLSDKVLHQTLEESDILSAGR